MKKEKIKNIVLIMVVAVISSTVTSFATSNYLFDSIDVKYDNSNGVQAETVQGAIDELYSCASDYSGIDTRVNTLEGYHFHGPSSNLDYITVGNDTKYTSERGFLLSDGNNNRGVFYYAPDTGNTTLGSYNSSGTFGQGTLNLAGNPVQVNGEDIMSPTYSSHSLSDKSISSGTTTSLGSTTVEPGLYIITFSVTFGANATGARSMGISTSNSSFTSASNMITVPNNGSSNLTRLQMSIIANVSSTTTYYFDVFQNSGSTLNATSGNYRRVKLK